MRNELSKTFWSASCICMLLGLALNVAFSGGCWDDIKHALDEKIGGSNVFDTAANGDASSGDATDSSIDSAQNVPTGQGDLPPGWEGFGAPCARDGECRAGKENARCLANIMGLINAPGGYCTACCKKQGENVCAKGIDCVGLDGVYLVCLAHCDAHGDCRQQDGWECRTLYYMEADFPGTYCLPREDIATPDSDSPVTDPHCPWPWL